MRTPLPLVDLSADGVSILHQRFRDIEGEANLFADTTILAAFGLHSGLFWSNLYLTRGVDVLCGAIRDRIVVIM